jgi:hypothetical protein
MQYQLAFLAAGPVRPDRAAFERYFSGLPHWSVGKGLARYANEDTDVSFSIHYVAPSTDLRQPWAVFTLALPRPSFFAEEATHELTPFASHFGAAIAAGSGVLEYSVPVFQREWEESNRRSCGPLVAHLRAGEPPFTMPRAELLAAWGWNFRRRAVQQQEGNSLFVPRIWFLRNEHRAGTCVIWPDLMAIRVPQVDFVIFSRDDVRPRHIAGRRADIAMASWSTIVRSITGDAFYDTPPANWRVHDTRVLNAISTLVSGLRGTTDMPEFLPSDAVLDVECFAARA